MNRIYSICDDVNEAPRRKRTGYQNGKSLILLGGTRSFPPNPSSACLPHLKRMGYSKVHNKPGNEMLRKISRSTDLPNEPREIFGKLRYFLQLKNQRPPAEVVRLFQGHPHTFSSDGGR